MADLRSQLNQRAARGEPRGAATVYRSAKAHAEDAPRTARAMSVSPSKRSRLRRWRLVVVAVVAVVIVVVGLVAFADSRRRGPRVIVSGPATTKQAFATRPAATLFWLDDRGLVEGNPKTGRQIRLSPATHFCQACPGVRIGGYVFLVQPRILRVDTTDGNVRDLGPGLLVFPNPDAASLYVMLSSESTTTTTTTVIERIDVNGHVLGGPWTLPTGQVLSNPPRAVIGGVLTQTDENAADHTLSVWNPATGLRSTVGPFRAVIDTYTAANATSSLVAYTAAGCDTTGCGLTIARIPGGPSHRVVAPEGAPGFIGGGAFSPDGDQLAAFVDRLPERDNPGGNLVIITVGTSAADRIVASTVSFGEPYGFAAWSADSQWLYFGGLSAQLKAHYRDTPDAIDLPLPAFYSIVAGPPSTSRGSP
jgi:hypothetical protein